MGCSGSMANAVNKDSVQIKRIQNQKVIKQLSWDRSSNQQESTIASIENIEFFYEFIKQIGAGQFGSVYLAKRRREPFNQVAIKILSLQELKKYSLEYIKREVQISKTLDHPNIIKFQETYIDKKNIYIVMEHCTGGNLSQKKFSEQQVLNIMKKLLYAVNYMHQRNIIHRDLKLENILYESDSPDSEIKIIDFGLSKQVPAQSKARRHSIVGSVTYMAPEVLSFKNYDKTCDIWSLGVIMYRLLCGDIPFTDRNQILDGILIFKNPIWSTISRDAFDLLKKMINIYPQYRITIDSALKHSWFQQRRGTVQLTQLVQLHPGHLAVLDRFSFYEFFSQFKKEVISMYVKRHVSKEQELAYRKLFKSIDSENKGFMTKSQLDENLLKVGIEKQNSENLALSPTPSKQSHDTIEYSEFLSACAGQDLVSDQEKLRGAYCLFDADGKQKITQKDIETALQREGRLLSKEKVQSLIEEIITYFDSEKTMNFESFCACMGYINNQEKKISKFAKQQDQISESEDEDDNSNLSNSFHSKENLQKKEGGGEEDDIALDSKQLNQKTQQTNDQNS